MSLILTLGLGWVAGLVLWIFVRDRLDPRRSIPGSPLLDPFFGVLLFLGVVAKGRIIRPLMDELRRFGPIRRSYLFLGEIRVMLSDAAAIKHVLLTNARNYTRGNYAGVEEIANFVGSSGLILISGEQHKRLRRVATPAFRPSALKSFFPLYDTCVRRLIRHWKGLTKDGPRQVNIKQGVSNTTLDVIGLAAFGFDYKSFAPELSVETRAVQELLKEGGITLWAVLPFYKQLFKARAALSLVLPSWVFPTETALGVVRGSVRAMVAERRQSSSGRANLLDLCLASEEGGGVTAAELEDMVMTFMLAGHETSAIALSWTLLLLAKHRPWLLRCGEEVDALFAKLEEKEIEWEDLKELPVMMQCIRESMRLFPPIPYVNRRSLGPDKLGEYDIPAGTDVLILSLELHRNPLLWGEDASQFRPERFQDGNEPAEGIYMPFGDGLHKCIGYQFSLNEVSVILAHVLREFDFREVEGRKHVELADVSLKPNPPVALTLSTREH